MRVLVLASLPHPKQHISHVATWVLGFIENMKKSGHEITVMNYSFLAKSQIESFRKDNISYIFIKTHHPYIEILTFHIFRILKMYGYIKKNHHKFDVIHIFGNEHQFEVIPKSALRKSVVHVQGIISEYLKYFTPKLSQKIQWEIISLWEKVGYRRIKNYVCRTIWDTSVIRRRSSHARIFQINEILRSEFYRTEKFGKGSNVIFMGGTNPIKGLDVALKAFAVIKKDHPGKLIVLGSVNEKVFYRLIRELNINCIDVDKDIKIKGHLNSSDIIKQYRSCFCLLHPSLIDNSPNTVCESQMLGIPVIANNVGGVQSIIEDGKTGFLTSSDPMEIADRMEKLWRNDDLWDRISENSREVAIQRHNIKRIIKDTENMYNEVNDW